MANEKNKYLLSVVIPTRNRQEYAIQAIKQVLNVTGEETQIVIQDNSDNTTLYDSIKEINTSRVKYNHHEGILSFVDNFEKAVSLAEGRYITLIGDDDGVLGKMIRTAILGDALIMPEREALSRKCRRYIQHGSTSKDHVYLSSVSNRQNTCCTNEHDIHYVAEDSRADE